MKEIEISKRLRAVSTEEWKTTLKKCFGHVVIKLKGKTLKGAHSEQRLGLPAPEFYVCNAYTALFQQTWEWQYEKYDLETQMVRIINSMISEQVRLYKVEMGKSKQLTLLVENNVLEQLLIDEGDEEQKEDIKYYEQCLQALNIVGDLDSTHKKFISLKLNGKNYTEIANELHCTVPMAYRLMETIARKTRKLLEQTN